MANEEIYYSDKYTDETHEYRHVMLPQDLVKLVPKNKLMSETASNILVNWTGREGHGRAGGW